jgi:hypothetical protein
MKPSFRLALLVGMLAAVAVLVFPTIAPASEEEKDIVGLPSGGYGRGVGSGPLPCRAPLDCLGDTAFAFLGRTDQHGPTLTHYGYLTHLFGVEDGSLFADPILRTEATARFTFFAETTLVSRHELGDIIGTAARGTLTIYFHGAGSDFNHPPSFARGQAIAVFSVQFHNILNVQAPNQGIASAMADLVQLEADPFTLEGRRSRFGRKGLLERVWSTGQSTRTQVAPPQAFFLLGGQAVVTDQRRGHER